MSGARFHNKNYKMVMEELEDTVKQEDISCWARGVNTVEMSMLPKWSTDSVEYQRHSYRTRANNPKICMEP
jgi:hypothetical protein